MRIIKRQEFLQLPSDTLFSTYTPHNFGDLCIKGDTLPPNDFRVQYISDSIDCHNSNQFDEILSNAEKYGSSFKMDFDCWSRDGSYDSDSQLYAVWEDADVKLLIGRLSQLLNK